MLLQLNIQIYRVILLKLSIHDFHVFAINVLQLPVAWRRCLGSGYRTARPGCLNTHLLLVFV